MTFQKASAYYPMPQRYKDFMYDEYCFNVPVAIADLFIASTCMETILQPGLSFRLDDAMEMVSIFSECTTLYMAIANMPVIYDTNFTPPNAAAVPTSIGSESVDFTVANTSTRYQIVRPGICVDVVILSVPEGVETMADRMVIMITIILTIAAQELRSHLQLGR
ncbi:hypothetical protein K440DRAFT_641835 [Wilcoxina mikolae CBS 423.85]|nr:hypothetical protein K440DRAFT_641835 [Wilcoxina mikolae CBS 423.85]